VWHYPGFLGEEWPAYSSRPAAGVKKLPRGQESSAGYLPSHVEIRQSDLEDNCCSRKRKT
jgi:hypothetical protein